MRESGGREGGLVGRGERADLWGEGRDGERVGGVKSDYGSDSCTVKPRYNGRYGGEG